MINITAPTDTPQWQHADRDHRADVHEALGAYATRFDVDGLTLIASQCGGVGKIDSLTWEHLLRVHAR